MSKPMPVEMQSDEATVASIEARSAEPAPTLLDARPAEHAPTRIEPLSVDVSLRLYHLEGSAQAALATLRRALIEKVPPTRSGLAYEAAIAFDLEDQEQALAIVDGIAQTVGISAF